MRIPELCRETLLFHIWEAMHFSYTILGSSRLFKGKEKKQRNLTLIHKTCAAHWFWTCNFVRSLIESNLDQSSYFFSQRESQIFLPQSESNEENFLYSIFYYGKGWRLSRRISRVIILVSLNKTIEYFAEQYNTYQHFPGRISPKESLTISNGDSPTFMIAEFFEGHWLYL